VAKVEDGGALVDEPNAALGYLERLYPDSIGEACFIDASGAENARVVRGVRAGVADLSLDEADTPFFAPTFALPEGQVHHTAPYVSPDTDEWVIANATRVPGVPAIVHFEVTIDSFRRAAAAGATGPVLVVDRRTGTVVTDSRHPQPIDAPLGVPGDDRFSRLVGGWGASGLLDIDGVPGAYVRAGVTAGSANDWYVVALSPTGHGPLSGVGALPVAVLVTAALVLAYAGLALRRRRMQLLAAARTDALTGLANRRALNEDLYAVVARAAPDRPVLLALFDLNGFKAYNDTFGHPAGDALLARLGAALRHAVEDRGRAYRLGGDEFCVVAAVERVQVPDVVYAAVQALSEHGEGFRISAAHGTILLPDDTGDAVEAMRLVDLRMYEQKASSRLPADAQTSHALLAALRERDPDLCERMRLSAQLAEAVCRHLGVAAPDAARIVAAAQIHDVGKVALPEALLAKTGPLDADERTFVRQAPLIGERITAAAPALAPLAPFIRACREHVDGSGYPDGLTGDHVPLGARIIAACSALAAMISDRPYAPRRTLEQASTELHRCAGSQFDPDVTDAVIAVADTVLRAAASPHSSG
jgi:diguanylate cyclase (GGDEF)-like protein